MIRADDTIVFQGDSITDAGRDRSATAANDPAGLGQGYVRDASAMLLAEHGPAALSIHNRGVGGDKVPALAARWQTDCLDLRPTVLSVLIGVNDVWHGLTGDPAWAPGTLAGDFASGLEKLLRDARAALPGLRLVVLGEPFVLPCGAGADLPFEPELSNRRRLVRQIAEDVRDDGPVAFVAYQDVFHAAMDRGIAPEALAADGVHPTMAGHMLMAKAWCDAVGGE